VQEEAPMVNPFYVFQGDTLPAWQQTLYDNNTGSAINLTGLSASSIQVWMHNQTTGTVIQLTGPVTIVNATQGLISYQWQASDTVVAGSYRLEVRLLWASGVQTVGPYPLVIESL
jgi:hypothetical protein